MMNSPRHSEPAENVQTPNPKPQQPPPAPPQLPTPPPLPGDPMPLGFPQMAPTVSEADEYIFAVEYVGPPLTYAVPQAIPILIDRIPVASVLPDPPHPVPDPDAVPVVDPIPSPVVRHPRKVPLFELGVNGCEADGVSSSGGLDGSPEFKESVDFSGDTIPPPERVSTESVLSSEFGYRSGPEEDLEGGRVVELEEGEGGEDDVGGEGNTTTRRGDPVVKFQESCGGSEEEEEEEREVEGTTPGTEDFVHWGRDECDRGSRKVKKGTCYRCSEGNRFTVKEVCIVCDAKYCYLCVLRAMGSMPEGRKCVSCIGYPIEEEKREMLGKCSRMLKKLLSTLEIEQIMKAEKYCEVNQLQSMCVCVNGNSLSSEEMVLLQSCGNPPKKLKPGHFWYDKVSGYWGKEGRKPDKIISPNLKIGGCLMENASNGNMGIFINGREITKAESRMLQLAGVQIAGNPHFWVNADGTYQEEGHKIIKGNLWDKSRMKLVCSLLSLPYPSKAPNHSRVENNVINGAGAVPDYLEQRSLQKLLLIGCPKAGTSTIFKQAKFLYNSVPFSDEEREKIKVTIHSSIYRYLGVLLEGREHFEEECLARKIVVSGDETHLTDDEPTLYSLCPKLKDFSDFLLKVRASGNLDAIFPAATREYAPLVEELWNDASIQATYSRRSELQSLPSVTSYFLGRAVDVSRPEYEPSNTDILYADGIASSSGLLAYTDFLLPNSLHGGASIDNDSQLQIVPRYQLIRVQTESLGDNLKCLEMFEDARMVIFCIALNDYSEFTENPDGSLTNKMLASKQHFESIVTHPSFEPMDFLLILNKFDLLEQKIVQTPLTTCDWFADFNPITTRHHSHHQQVNNRSHGRIGNGLNSTPAQQAFYYIAVKFKRLFSELTGGRKLYVTMTNAIDVDTVDSALRYSKEIMNWEDERVAFGASEPSVYSTEPYSYSD